MYAGENHRGVLAGAGDAVAVGAGDALDELVAAEPPQVVSHLPGGDGGQAAEFGGELAQVGYTANRRLLDVERLTTDPTIGEGAFRAVADPIIVGTQRASALPFGTTRTQALLAALLVFRLLPQGFRNRDLRAHLAPLLGIDPALMTPGRMTYEIRRLRLHGLIERIPDTHRYRVTDHGLAVAVFLTRVHNRLIRTGLAELEEPDPTTPPACGRPWTSCTPRSTAPRPAHAWRRER